jgi:hypothetical protein
MDNNRKRDSRTEHNTHERNRGRENNQGGKPYGFEGMNFEQVRGRYNETVDDPQRQDQVNGRQMNNRQENL